MVYPDSNLPSLAVQAALWSKLNADSTLSGLVTGVFDAVPDNQAYPYVQLGIVNERPYLTLSRPGAIMLHDIRIFGGGGEGAGGTLGNKQVLEIANRVNQLLGNRTDLVVTGWDVVATWYNGFQILTDPDEANRKLRSGVAQYRTIVQQTVTP